MAYTELMMSMDKPISVSQMDSPISLSEMDGPLNARHISSCSSKKIMWIKKMKHKFIDFLLEQVHLGRKGEGGFKKD